MSNIKVEPYSLKDLKEKFENREFAIPQIQRLYVWNKTRICDLMDSIYRNYPIGIGLVWTTTLSKAIHIRSNKRTIIPIHNQLLPAIDLIIDGQQRISTLYGVLNGCDANKEANSMINFKELYFVCDKKSEKRFIFSKHLDENSKGHVRLNDLLNTSIPLLRKRHRLSKYSIKEIEKCKYAFDKYRFYILHFERMDFNDVKNIFIRINSSGMKVSRADTIFSSATNVKLRDRMIDVQRGLKSGYNNISVDTLLSTLGFAYEENKINGPSFRKKIAQIDKQIKDKKNTDEFNKTWKKLLYGYTQAVDFLVKDMGIQNPSLLPSQNIYTMLAYFFYLNKSLVTSKQLKEIKKWFWHTACNERYSGAGFNRNIPEDIKFFRRLAKRNNNAKYTIDEKVNPVDFLKSSYKTASSTSNAYYVLLRKKCPLYLANGQELILDNASSMSNKKDRHHIFPRNLLKKKINMNSKWINSISNICYLESERNKSFGDLRPWQYLEEFKHKKHFSRVMKTHIIPYTATSPIWNHNIKQGFLEFINLRGKMILGEIEKLAGAKIFEKLDPIKRI